MTWNIYEPRRLEYYGLLLSYFYSALFSIVEFDNLRSHSLSLYGQESLDILLNIFFSVSQKKVSYTVWV